VLPVGENTQQGRGCGYAVRLLLEGTPERAKLQAWTKRGLDSNTTSVLFNLIDTYIRDAKAGKAYL